MNYNPYTSQVREVEARIATLVSTIDAHNEQHSWHRSFDATAAAQRLTEDTAVEKSYAIQVQETDVSMQALQKQIAELEEASKLGWNRARWLFASDRTKAKLHLVLQRKRLTTLETQKSTYIAEQNRTRESIATTNDALQHHASFDVAAADSRIAALRREIESSREELAVLQERKAARSQLIDAPFHKLQGVEQEIRSLEHDVAEAERMDRELSQAANGYERKLIHNKSQREFDDGNPRRVAERAMRKIPTKRREAEKLHRRIEELIQRESQDIRSLIIDGSNLCYEGDKFIGLFAVRQLCEQISEEIELSVVFDGSILKKLGLLSEEALRAKMPGVTVHLIHDAVGADETILDAAASQTSYVISGDKFADFPEKAAVEGERVLSVEVINKRVLIPRLDINFEYTNEILSSAG